jgi:predicted lactoylglutathione lyase
MVISEDIYAMLLTQAKFGEFMPKAKTIADAHKTTEVMVALSADSKAAVDMLCDTAMKAGAGEVRPTQDYGFMYGRSFADLDGHIWEVIWMDPSAIQKS